MHFPAHERSFRESKPGLETIAAGFFQPRHAHLKAYATVIVDGGYGHAGYFGRRWLEPGDVLVTPLLDRHENRTPRRRNARLLRFDWSADTSLGGVYRPARIDTVVSVARRDPIEARHLLREALASSECVRPALADWPDLLAQRLRAGRTSISGWAAGEGLARETVARGFRKTYGTSPRAFAGELRARSAWVRIFSGGDSFAKIAMDLGYADQPHMTRAVRSLTGLSPGAWRKMRNGPAKRPPDR
ncbi:helix-turn-helix domain-containing protein [Luteimonas gilva]|uniref:Helix-turn-helix domain-containing protein n=1 Tax=Luteimonas gilva TaxID=2572684 RepID=A0A4U5JP36_9GAMM|nr:helix-turn-helix domain-containing protein [Luteimonas gilva]TKR31055.1 helix-turn-helix domain-containing protein [Luteimonas gilva]